MPNDRVKKILKDREGDYGDAKVNLTAIGRMWGALLQIDDIPAYRVALMMDAFKSVRCFANPHKLDSWDDKEGYTHHGRDLVPEIEG
jgi:hypothetical protein